MAGQRGFQEESDRLPSFAESSSPNKPPCAGALADLASGVAPAVGSPLNSRKRVLKTITREESDHLFFAFFFCRPKSR